MPRGVPKSGVRKARKWTDANGVEHESFGRPSKEEIAARSISKDQTLATKNIIIEEPAPETTTIPMDIPSFLEQTTIAVKALRASSELSNFYQEKIFLKGLAGMLEVQIMEKYKKIKPLIGG